MALAHVNDVLDRVRALLDQGNPEEAMAVLAPHRRSGSKLIASAYAVCLMRLGQYDEAAKLLRDLVYQGSSLAMASDLPLVVKTNFATALLLTHNIDGAAGILAELNETQDSIATKLKTALARWEQSLTLCERLKRLWGTPKTRVTLDFPPGDV